MLRKGAFFDTYYIMCNRPVCGTFRRLRSGGDKPTGVHFWHENAPLRDDFDCAYLHAAALMTPL
jgi:hypothetical protein